MITTNDAILLSITEEDIKSAIKKTLAQNFNQRDNLRARHSHVQFDSLLRGYIGEIGIVKWFKEYNIQFSDTNYIDDNSGNIDIDLLYRYGDKKEKTLEIKTSLIPDNYVKNIQKNDITSKIDSCINNFDIKLIRRNNESVQELKGDIHIQIYFGDLRKAKDTFLENVLINLNIQNKTIDNTLQTLIDTIYESIHSRSYLNRTFLVGWIDKKTLIEQLNTKLATDRIWTFGGSRREFWTCKIKNEAKKPIDLINYIKSLK